MSLPGRFCKIRDEEKMKKKLKIFFLFLLVVLINIHCGKRENKFSSEVILARIGDKTISVNEFMRRAEYTIRPAYCKYNSYIHKKIILNSLIAEKLLALEAGEENELTANEQFQDYLKGRKQQAMLQYHYYNDFYNKVKLDTSEINRMFRLAGRTYHIEYVSVKDSAIASEIKKKLDEGKTLAEIFPNVEKIPTRDVHWKSPENELIHEALFTSPLKKDQHIGPIKIEKNFYTFIQIKGWTDRLAISDKDIQQRREDVERELKEKRATGEYLSFVRKVMAGKMVEFNEDVFYQLVKIVGPVYMKSTEEKKKAFNQKFWHKQDNEFVVDEASEDISAILDKPLLKIDNNVWTVRRFQKELNIHPLVFRKRQMKKSEFAEQFKLAIVDMIQDKYVATEAEKKGYGNAPEVIRNVNMWQDNLIALFQRNKYLRSIGKEQDFYKNSIKVIEDDLNPYLEQLRNKYNGMIEINTDEFEKLQLTNIDMFVIQKNVPFPIVVPNFPVITTHNKLDYGKKMTFKSKE